MGDGKTPDLVAALGEISILLLLVLLLLLVVLFDMTAVDARFPVLLY